MRKIIAVLIIAAMCCVSVGCTKNVDTEQKNKRIAIADRGATWRIFVDKETGVMYLNSKAGSGESMCVMLNRDGTPAIYKGGDKE